LLADDRAQKACLADAVASQDASDLAQFRAERHAPQGLGRSIVQIYVVDFEHQRTTAIADEFNIASLLLKASWQPQSTD
jgi:hypothetical protein